jgi:hypothetical protein
MGHDKLINYLYKNLNNECIEEINIVLEIKKIVANHIMFDISFLIYQILLEIEDEINSIIKIVLNLPFYCFNLDLMEEKLDVIIDKPYWKDNIDNIHSILKGDNEDEIIINFISNLSKNNLIENIIIDKIFNKLKEYIILIHFMDTVETINIIFDGIPSYSKILEQRRRRIKNHIESQERKQKFDIYFDNIENSYQSNDGINYDYFKWLKYRFSLDKSFGPSSLMILRLEKELEIKLKNNFPNIKILINSGNINGEADYKIFNIIHSYNYVGDIVIHTIDSDLVHEIIVQQNYFQIKKKDIYLSVVRYNLRNDNVVQYIEASNINKNLMKIYNCCNNININNSYIIYDLAFIFFFFGNDHLPSSLEIGPELTLEYYCKTHYNTFKKDKKKNTESSTFITDSDTIINLNDDEIRINFTNLNLFLKEIDKNEFLNKTRIILGRYFKIPNQLIIYLVDKCKLTFDNVLLLCKKILFDSGKEMKEELDEDDLRLKLINKYSNVDYPLDTNTLDIKEFKINCNKLLSILDISESDDKFYGLPIYNKPFYLLDDNNKNFYLNFNEIIITNLIKKNPLIYDYIPIEQILNSNFFSKTPNLQTNNMITSYIRKIYHLTSTLFGNMTNYNSNNLTYYSDYIVPSLKSIINELNTNNTFNFEEDILKDNITHENYFNSIDHHLIITPFIKNIKWKFKNENLSFFINNVDLKNFWFNMEDNFLFKNFDINEFKIKWNIVLEFLKKSKENNNLLLPFESSITNFSVEDLIENYVVCSTLKSDSKLDIICI